MNLVEVLVSWLQMGAIGWGIWLVTGISYVCFRTKGDKDVLERFGKEAESESEYVSFKKSPLKGKVRIIARTIIWPWGMIETATYLEESLNRALQKN